MCLTILTIYKHESHFIYCLFFISIDLLHQECALIMFIITPVSVKVATLVMIAMLKSTSVSPLLAFAVSTLVDNTKQQTSRKQPIKMAATVIFRRKVSWSLSLAQNNFQQLDFDGSFKTILYHLMLLSWCQKTVQSLVNKLIIFVPQ